MNILIVDDEQDIRDLLELHLLNEGYTVFQAENGNVAFDVFQKEKIGLAILDVRMPGLDGFRLLKKIREQSQIPVLFLTACREDADKILGLGLGADDYIVKPFNPMEVIARVKAQWRGYYNYGIGDEGRKSITLGGLTLDKESCTIYKDGELIQLNAKVFKIAKLLIENAGRVFTKRQIYESIWGEDYFGDDNTIMVHISYLREKVEDDPKKPVYLKTIRGIGYKMERDPHA